MHIGERSCYLLANYSRNMVSTYRLQELINDDFEIEVRVKIDWDTFIKSKQNFAGIVVLNGVHFGIMAKIYPQGKVISAEVWSANRLKGEGKWSDLIITTATDKIHTDVNIVVDEDTLDEWRTIKMTYRKNKSLILTTTEGTTSKYIDGDILNYEDSYLWVGCCDNHKPTLPEFQGNWCGDISKLKIKGKEKVFMDLDFKKKTRYKIYDESGSGNHLIKKQLNDEGHIIVF